MTFLTLYRLLPLLSALAVLIETSLMVRDNWRAERMLIAARLASRAFLTGVLVYYFITGLPFSPRASMLLFAVIAYFTAEMIHRVTARKIKKDIVTIFNDK